MSADQIFADAEKQVNKMFFKDYAAAQELFMKAGARYKLDKDFARAGNAFSRAAECAVHEKQRYDAGVAYVEAARAYSKVDVTKAKLVLDLAVNMKIDDNRLGDAAQLLQEFAASLEEQEFGTDALAYYAKAVDYFNAEDRKAQAQKCMLAMAKIYGEIDDFDKSLMYYERIANNMLGGPLKFQAQDYYLRAMLCRFAMVNNDNRFEKSVECQEALQQYLTSDIYLKNTREHEFLQLVLDAVTDCDIEKFEMAVSLLQDIRKLDDWKTHVLLVVKHNMESLT